MVRRACERDGQVTQAGKLPAVSSKRRWIDGRELPENVCSSTRPRSIASDRDWPCELPEVLFGLTLIAFEVSIFLSTRYPGWLGGIGLLDGVGL
jgi:hypothetical protein